MTQHRGFASKAQAKYLRRVHPTLAKDMQQHTPNMRRLPKRAAISSPTRRRRQP